VSSSIPKEENLLGYVIVDVPGEGVARLLYDGWRITQNWFPIGQCIEHCIECGVTNPTVYTQEEFLKALPKVSISDLDDLDDGGKTC
jgi:hypothetical protein